MIEKSISQNKAEKVLYSNCYFDRDYYQHPSTPPLHETTLSLMSNVKCNSHATQSNFSYSTQFTNRSSIKKNVSFKMIHLQLESLQSKIDNSFSCINPSNKNIFIKNRQNHVQNYNLIKELNLSNKEENKENDFSNEKSEMSHENTHRKWTRAEHIHFIDGVLIYKSKWDLIQKHVQTKTVNQIKLHSQKFYMKVEKLKVFANKVNSNKLLYEEIHRLKDKEKDEKIKFLYEIPFKYSEADDEFILKRIVENMKAASMMKKESQLNQKRNNEKLNNSLSYISTSVSEEIKKKIKSEKTEDEVDNLTPIDNYEVDINNRFEKESLSLKNQLKLLNKLYDVTDKYDNLKKNEIINNLHNNESTSNSPYKTKEICKFYPSTSTNTLYSSYNSFFSNTSSLDNNKNECSLNLNTSSHRNDMENTLFIKSFNNSPYNEILYITNNDSDNSHDYNQNKKYITSKDFNQNEKSLNDILNKPNSDDYFNLIISSQKCFDFD